MISVKKEPIDMYKNTRVLECCIFCNKETMYWHVKTNRPICKQCSNLYLEKNIKEAKYNY